jgi:hypothetical protein
MNEAKARFGKAQGAFDWMMGISLFYPMLDIEAAE